LTFDGLRREVEAARAELAKAGRDAQGWSDRGRQAFNEKRMMPLADAGARLMAALETASERCKSAEKLLSDS
jgi:hypothetical protein